MNSILFSQYLVRDENVHTAGFDYVDGVVSVADLE